MVSFVPNFGLRLVLVSDSKRLWPLVLALRVFPWFWLFAVVALYSPLSPAPSDGRPKKQCNEKAKLEPQNHTTSDVTVDTYLGGAVQISRPVICWRIAYELFARPYGISSARGFGFRSPLGEGGDVQRNRPPDFPKLVENDTYFGGAVQFSRPVICWRTAYGVFAKS